MYNILISAFANLLRTLLIRKFMIIFFDIKEFNRKLEWIAYTIFYLITLIFFLIFNSPVINLITNTIGLSIITTIYVGSLKKKVFFVAAIYSFNMVCDTISGFSLSNYIVGQENNQLFQIFTVLLLLICQLCTEKLVAKRRQAEFSAKYWWILFFIPLTSMIILFFMLYRNLEDRFFIVLGSTGILIINIIVFYLYNALLNNYLHTIEKENLQKQVVMYSNQLEVIMHTQNKIRSLQHDMKHHTTELYAMAKQDEKKEIMDYLQRMTVFMENPEEHVFSGNKEVDSVINYLVQQAKAVLNEVNIKICIPEDINFPIFDLNVILGNLLENAIEASRKSKDKTLNLIVKMERDVLFIYISNSYAGNIKIKNGKIITTKENKESHGIGMNNVKRIVESYDGIMDIMFENNLFEVDLMLYMKNEKIS